VSRALLVALLLSGCVKDRPFECESSADCVRGDEAGVCEPTGFCSFADASCGQAVRRYGELAGLDLGGTCVPCVAELGGGASHLCARRQDGHLQCWGDNDRGQIGDGSSTERVLPVDIDTDEDGEPLGAVLDIGLGSHHTCAVTANGTYCWGENSSGELGDPSLELHPAPTPLPVDAISIAAGLSHTCWLTEGGAVDCIGDNAASQLGADQDAVPSSSDPVEAVASGAAAVALGAGAFHTCAVMDDDSLRCWGGNADGEVGDGSFDNAREPATVRPAGSTGRAATSDRFSCSIDAGGAVLCWGDNTYGQLGNGDLEDREVPTEVALEGEATQIALGDDHACARMKSGELWCWGSNALGQLGPDAGAMEKEPVRVRDDDVLLVAAAANTTCFLELSGTVLCMGAGSSGERGNGREEDGAEPVEVGLSCDTVP
jgi:alpha-tubulin suppressor-like RCC1 family protein